MKKSELQNLLDDCATKLLAITAAHPNFRINIVLPGFMLQLIDPLLLSRLNELQKNDCAEWVSTGYTEPFWSFSPLWLSSDNMQQGMTTFHELLRYTPVGYMSPFSNWEPSSLPILRKFGIQYVVLNHSLFENNNTNYCGYWVTEFNGNSMAILPAHDVHYHNCPANILEWFDRIAESTPPISQMKILIVRYMLPLQGIANGGDPFKWIALFANSLETILIKYQICLLHEFLETTLPLGLHYIPPCLIQKDQHEYSVPYFANYLHSFDSFGILHRKMIELAELIQPNCTAKELQPYKKRLFAIQDINRFLPNAQSGFTRLTDRCWTFSQIAELERELVKKDRVNGGQIRITDFLKNGTKSLVMANKALKVYIDYKNGGQLIALDFKEKAINIICGFGPNRTEVPRIIMPGKSPTAFIDYILPENYDVKGFQYESAKFCGDFTTGTYEYKVKKTASSVKAILTHQGSLVYNDKLFPLTLEKVFGLDSDKAELTFVYQLTNPSLAPYAFRFACLSWFAFPGALNEQVFLKYQKTKFGQMATQPVLIDEITHWTFFDYITGCRLHFNTQKPVTVLCYPLLHDDQNYQGSGMLMSMPVSLQGNAQWTIAGKMSFKKTHMRGSKGDVV
ncbi:MAG: DUF1926 domain-containing protein [Chitinivibrionales bacterium]|nr:DUF1926 domain-containing protein [Chitinivibrionales bacterium]